VGVSYYQLKTFGIPLYVEQPQSDPEIAQVKNGFSILMLTTACYPVSSTEAIVNAKLVLACLEAGWQIDVISGNRAGWYPGKEEEMWNGVAKRVVCCLDRDRDLTLRRILGEAKGTLMLGKPIIGSGWANRAIRESIRLVRENNYDIVFARTPPAFLAALHLGRRTGIPWIANWNDPWPVARCPAPYGYGQQARIAIYKRQLIEEVGREAAWHTFCCERLRRYICQYGPKEMMDRSSVIPHIALSQLSNQHARPNPEKFTLCHAGMIKPPRVPDVFFAGLSDFAKTVRDRKRISVVFFGPQYKEMSALISAYGVGDIVHIKEPCSYGQSIRRLADMDVLVIIEAKCAEGVFLPSKFIDYVQTGRPILAVSPTRGTLSDVISSHGGGLLADCTRRDEVAAALTVLYHHWQEDSLDSRFGSAHLLSLYGEDLVLSEYARLFSRLGI